MEKLLALNFPSLQHKAQGCPALPFPGASDLPALCFRCPYGAVDPAEPPGLGFCLQQ